MTAFAGLLLPANVVKPRDPSSGPSAVAVYLAAALRLASLRLRDCRWCSAQVGQRVWLSIAGSLQFRHWLSSLAFCRCSWARRRLYSLRSGVLFLTFSYARPFWRVLLVLAKGVSSGALSPLSWWTLLFGFGEPLVPAFGSFRVFGSAFLPGPAALEGFLLRWALPGRGKENSKVRPSIRAGGVLRGYPSVLACKVVPVGVTSLGSRSAGWCRVLPVQ